jgi:quercetin dioxygenase-like cupin family protein
MAVPVKISIADKLEPHMLQLPQVECPVVHHFGPGIYIREVTIPAGTFVAGHAHKHEHLNLLLSGEIKFLGEDGQLKTLKAPMIVISPPGRKIAYTVTETVWQNIHATEETDLQKLEEMFVEKSEAWISNDEAKRLTGTHVLEVGE